MYEVTVNAMSLIEHFTTSICKSKYNPTDSSKIVIIPSVGSQMVDFYQYLKHFGLLTSREYFEYDNHIFKGDFDEYVFEPYGTHYIEDNSEVLTFEFPDEETALYFKLKFNPEIVHEKN